MLSKVVKHKSGHKGVGKPGDWKVVLAFDWRDIPSDIPLTTRAINRWKKNHRPPFHYVPFTTLRKGDILGVLSQAKTPMPSGKPGVALQIDRFGRIAYYKLQGLSTR